MNSKKIAKSVEEYYKSHFENLNDDKKFHFATRMSAWYDDLFSRNYLSSVRDIYVRDTEDIVKDLRSLIENPPAAKINAAEERAPYFAKYPELRGLMLALFRVRHLLAVYSVDMRQELADLFPIKNMRELSDALLADEPALKVLSTYAINTIYLIDEILYPSEGREIDVERLYQVGKTYTQSSPTDLQLLIYFYTHCIIGASNFYIQALPAADIKTYQKMVTDLESVVSNNYSAINLDNKLELLVCAQIAGVTSSIADDIYAEVEQSISNEGVFVVDTLNDFKQSNKTSFSDSEHRNVLFLLSTGAYPHL